MPTKVCFKGLLLLTSLLCFFTVFSHPSCAGSGNSRSLKAQPAELVRAREQAEQRQLWQDPYWRALLHYEERFLFAEKSQIDDERFFLSSRGKKDPRAELLANLNAVFHSNAPPQDGVHPQCRFRARFEWLIETLSIDRSNLPDVSCNRYDRWIKEIDPLSLTLVFSNYSFNAMESSFGHLFIRINSRQRAPNHILDYAVNYAADIDASRENPVVFALKGVFGGYRGKYAIVPYFIKIRQYNDLEHRDLWEYELNLDRADMIRLLNHIWELQFIDVNYYFFKENCSFQILKLLEIAKPDLSLRNTAAFWNIPGDSLKAVKSAEMIRERTYRPSVKSQIQQKLALLDERAEDLFFRLISEPEVIDTPRWQRQTTQTKALLLEAYIEYLSLNNSTHTRDHLYQYVRRRHALNVITTHKEPEPTSSPPDEGHESASFRLFAGRHAILGSFGEASIKPAYHGLLDNSHGFFRSGEIELFELGIRYYQDFGWVLDKLTICRFKSLVPYNRILPSASWKIAIGIDNKYDIDCPECTINSVEGGYGISFQAGPALFYALPDVRFNWADEYENGYQAGFGIETGLLVDINRRTKASVNSKLKRYHFGKSEDRQVQRAQLRHSVSRNLDIRFDVSRSDGQEELKLGMTSFF